MWQLFLIWLSLPVVCSISPTLDLHSEIHTVKVREPPSNFSAVGWLCDDHRSFDLSRRSQKYPVTLDTGAKEITWQHISDFPFSLFFKNLKPWDHQCRKNKVESWNCKDKRNKVGIRGKEQSTLCVSTPLSEVCEYWMTAGARVLERTGRRSPWKQEGATSNVQARLWDSVWIDSGKAPTKDTQRQKVNRERLTLKTARGDGKVYHTAIRRAPSKG